jgi:hypothetical protein
VRRRAAGGADTLGLTLWDLDDLVAGAAEERRDRLEEWRWYLDYLRRRSRPDGSIPREYRLLVRLVFGDLPGIDSDQPSSAARSDST